MRTRLALWIYRRIEKHIAPIFLYQRAVQRDPQITAAQTKYCERLALKSHRLGFEAGIEAYRQELQAHRQYVAVRASRR